MSRGLDHCRAFRLTRRDLLRGAAGAMLSGVAARAADDSGTRPKGLIGYTEYRTNLPGGRHANGVTMRACVVIADGTGPRRILAEELAREPNSWTQFAGWSPDGRTAYLGR